MTVDQVENEVNRLMMILEQAELLKKGSKDLHPSQNRLRLDMISNMSSDAIKNLVKIARFARTEGLPIPQKLSYWMVDYIANDLLGENELQIMKDVKSHNNRADEQREHMGYIFTVNEIIRGFEKGFDHKVEGKEQEVTGNLTTVTVGTSKKKLSASQYGYVLAQTKKKKLTVTDAQMFFEATLYLSSSQIGKLFTKHKLNDIIKRANESTVAK